MEAPAMPTDWSDEAPDSTTANLTADSSTIATITASDSTNTTIPSSHTSMQSSNTANPFAACHKVLATPELCSSILDYIRYDELPILAEVGGPFLNCIKGSLSLSKELHLIYHTTDDHTSPYNKHFFWHNVFCGHQRRDPNCRCAMWESLDEEWEKGGRLPFMEIDFTNEPVELRFESYGEVVKALESKDFFLHMLVTTVPADIKLLIKNHDTGRGSSEWQGPPNVLHWATAEITVNNRQLRTGDILRIVKSLYECVEALDEERKGGKVLEWDEEDGTVAKFEWEKYFSEKDRSAVLSGQPKYFWFWKAGRADRWYPSTCAEHYVPDWYYHL